MKLFWSCIFLLSFASYSQSLISIKTVSLKNEIVNASIDFRSSLYVSDNKGNLYQFDSIGNEVNHFSAIQSASITLIEASKTMNVFLFYRDLQKYAILNRFLFNDNLSSIDRETIGFAYTAAPSLDNNLWIFDNLSFSLKKYDLTLQKVTIESPLDLRLDANNYDINYLKEYQNKIYLNDLKRGILVLDNLGNYAETLPFKTSYFNFLGTEIYFMQDNELIFYDLYSGRQRVLATDCSDNCSFALAFNNKVILVKEVDIKFYSIQ